MATIVGTPGNDNLAGTPGQDFIDGRGGADVIDGGAGFDYLDFLSATAAVTANLSSGDGDDTVTNVEAIRGSDFNDNLTGNNGSNFLRGMKGNDFLDGGAGNDFADYWQASGPVSVSLATNSSTGPDGNDTFVNIESISGSQFNDVLTGSAGSNQIRGQKGDDLLDGGAGSDDAVFYQDASGPVTVNLAAGTATGADGNDTLVNFEDIGGSPFDDTLIGNDEGNFLYGLAGNDRLVGGPAGTADFDYASYIQSSGPVTVNLATGTSSGPHGADTFESIEGIEGSNFDDNLTGDNNNNVLVGRSGNDKLDGGPNSDTAAYFSAPGAVTVDLAAGTATGADGNDTLISIENARGSRFNDTLLGDDGTNLLSGEAGDDALDGRGGNDYADFRQAPNAVTVNLGIQGTAQNTGWGNDTLVNMESIRGSQAYGDTLIGDGGDNTFRPMGGDDNVNGGAGTDTVSYSEPFYELGAVAVNLAAGTVTGALGNDTLVSIENARGTIFDDTLIGSSGDNQLRGDEGSDLIDGGAGNDTAVYGNAQSAYVALQNTGQLAVGTSTGTDRLFNIESLAFADRTVSASSVDSALEYVASYTDLMNAFGTNGQAGLDHFVAAGYAEGRRVSFDGLEYVASYDDLIGAFGANTDAGAAHYIANGRFEGRQATFDGLQYIASYGDLITAFGPDASAGAGHFITNGKAEGRAATFDGLEYTASYGDLIAAFGTNEPAATQHFITNGFGEGRTVSFDGLQYIASYGDLIAAFGPNSDAGSSHFITNGFAESRAPDTFDEAQYLRNYADLQAAFGSDTEAATIHYITNGYAEGRTDQPLP